MADMSSFRQAREVVQQKLGETLADGYEDELDYNVLLADPATDDQVNLVSKRTGKLHRELFFAQESRLNAMTPVRDD
jgi:hypothetical protein